MVRNIWKSLVARLNPSGPSRACRKHRFRPQIGILDNRVVPAVVAEFDLENDSDATTEDFIENTEVDDGIEGEITAGDVDWSFFDAQAGDRVVITVTSDDDTFDASFELFDPNGDSLGFIDEGGDGDTESATFDLTKSGEYFILVETGLEDGPDTGSDGFYTVFVDRPGTIQFESANITVNENGGLASLIIRRTGGLDGAVSATYSLSGGTAAQGSDFTASSGKVNFAQGESVQTLNVPIHSDLLLESPETIRFTLSNPTEDAKLGSQTTATITINDTTTRPASVSVKKMRNGKSKVNVFDNTGKLRKTFTPFGKHSGKVTAKLKDLNGDGLLDLVAKATINGRVVKKKYFSV